MRQGPSDKPRESPPDLSYLPAIDRQTLSEDASYQAEILERHPTIFLRPDDRTSAEQSLKVDEDGLNYLGMIVEYGSHEEKKLAVHSEPHIRVRVVSQEPKRIREMSAEEFEHAYQEIHDPQSTVVWLKKKYPKQRFSTNSMVTVYRVEYV